jgi:sorbitol-specific phosphotransferase system component IIBC
MFVCLYNNNVKITIDIYTTNQMNGNLMQYIPKEIFWSGWDWQRDDGSARQISDRAPDDAIQATEAYPSRVRYKNMRD